MEGDAGGVVKGSAFPNTPTPAANRLLSVAAGAETPAGAADGMTPGAGAAWLGGAMVGFHTPAGQVMGADTPGSMGGSFGVPSGGAAGRGRGFTPVQPSQRWVIYYDKNGNELQRKMKGPGRLPRGAILEGDNYIVRDCVVNKNTQEVMTVPAYIPPEQRKDKYRAETEQFLGYEIMPVNPMMAPMGMPQRPQLRMRMKTDVNVEDDNPYAKLFRGPVGARPSDRGPDGEMQSQKASAAYTKRLKSPYHFPAPVPPEDRDTYDRGYSLLPGGGRGEYSVPRFQVPGEESYALTLDGVFQLVPPCDASSAQQVPTNLPTKEASAAVEVVRPLVEEGDKDELGCVADGKTDDAPENTATGPDAGGGVTGPDNLAAEDVEEEAAEDADVAGVVALWRSLGAPGSQSDASPNKQKRGVDTAHTVDAMETEEDASPRDDGAAQKGGRNAQQPTDVAAKGHGGILPDRSAVAELPLLHLHGRAFGLVDVYRAVASFGGSKKVHTWSLVGQALLQSKEGGNTGNDDINFAALALRVREWFTRCGLDRVEECLALAAAEKPAMDKHSADSGDSAEMKQGDEQGDVLVVMDPHCNCFEIGEGIAVNAKTGMLELEVLLEQNHGEQWRPSHDKLLEYATSDRSWEAQKRWWARYQDFARARGMPADSPNISVVSPCGQQKSLALFTIYHDVRARGGIELVLANKCLPDVLRGLDLQWSPALGFLLRKIYVRALYSFELKDCRDFDVVVTSSHELLFCVPMKQRTAQAALAARKVSVPLDPTCLPGQDGLAGAMGAATGGIKRVLERSSGNHAPEDAFERQKRLCRSLDSRCRVDVTWSLGVLTMSSWEAAKGIEPHVALTDAISGALARYLTAVVRERPALACPGYVLVTAAGAEENIEGNIEAVLTVLKNFMCAPHLAPAYAYNADLGAALGLCLLHGSDGIRLQTLEGSQIVCCPLPLSFFYRCKCSRSVGVVWCVCLPACLPIYLPVGVCAVPRVSQRRGAVVRVDGVQPGEPHDLEILSVRCREGGPAYWLDNVRKLTQTRANRHIHKHTHTHTHTHTLPDTPRHVCQSSRTWPCPLSQTPVIPARHCRQLLRRVESRLALVLARKDSIWRRLRQRGLLLGLRACFLRCDSTCALSLPPSFFVPIHASHPHTNKMKFCSCCTCFWFLGGRNVRVCLLDFVSMCLYIHGLYLYIFMCLLAHALRVYVTITSLRGSVTIASIGLHRSPCIEPKSFVYVSASLTLKRSWKL